MGHNPERLVPLKYLLKADKKAIEREVFLFKEKDELRRVLFCLSVRDSYKREWKWGKGAEHLYRALIRGLGLHGMLDELVEYAKPKRGRRKETALAARIWAMKDQGMKAKEIKQVFESEGLHSSLEKIESYLKTRRKKPISSNP